MKTSWVAIGIFIAGLMLLGGIFWRDIAASGRLTLEDPLVGYHPWISDIFPTGRLSAVEKKNDGFEQTVLEEPVYFTVRLPREMEQVRVRIRYRARDLKTLKVGLAIQGSPGETWRYDLRDISPTTPEAGSESEVIFSMRNAAVANRNVRFMIASPDFDSSRSSLAIQHIGIDFEGKKLSIVEILKKGIEKMKRSL